MRAECFRHSRRSRGRATRQRFRCTSGARVARYYDPATAQFLTRDPIEQLTQQPYQYSNDGPLDFTDPTGLFGWGSIAHAAAWVAVGAGVVAVAAVTVAAAPVAIPIEASVLATTASVAGGTALAASLVETGAACYDAATGGSISGRECAVDAASTVAAGAAGVSADEAYKVVSGAGASSVLHWTRLFVVRRTWRTDNASRNHNAQARWFRSQALISALGTSGDPGDAGRWHRALLRARLVWLSRPTLGSLWRFGRSISKRVIRRRLAAANAAC